MRISYAKQVNKRFFFGDFVVYTLFHFNYFWFNFWCVFVAHLYFPVQKNEIRAWIWNKIKWIWMEATTNNNDKQLHIIFFFIKLLKILGTIANTIKMGLIYWQKDSFIYIHTYIIRRYFDFGYMKFSMCDSHNICMAICLHI